MLYNEVFYRQFANRRDVAAYVGLTPSLFASGDLRHDQGISKAGNPRARATMVELAWLWVRHQSGSALTAWFLARVSGIKGRIKRICRPRSQVTGRALEISRNRTGSDRSDAEGRQTGVAEPIGEIPKPSKVDV